MLLKRIPVGELMANCYIFGDSDTKEAVIIDPGADEKRIFDAVSSEGLTIKYIALTHSHFDHVGALEAVKKQYNAPLVSESFSIGRHKVEVIKTPGHSPDGLCFRAGNIIFTGDTLFNSSVGRCDLPGGDFNTLKSSILRLYALPDETTVYPGHGLSTTIGKEKRYNPFVKADE